MVPDPVEEGGEEGGELFGLLGPGLVGVGGGPPGGGIDGGDGVVGVGVEGGEQAVNRLETVDVIGGAADG